MRDVLRSRAIVATSLVLAALLAGAAIVPGGPARVAALIAAGWAVPLLTALLVRHVVIRGRRATAARFAALQERLHELDQQQHALADRYERLTEAAGQRLAETLEKLVTRLSADLSEGWRQEAEALRAATGALRDQGSVLGDRLEDVAAAQAAQAERHDRTLADLAATVRPLVQRTSDQISMMRAVLRESTSALVARAGVGADALPVLRLRGGRRATAISLDGPAPDDPVDLPSVDSVVVVAGTLTDLRRLAGRAAELPAASRVLVVVLRSAMSIPLPTLTPPTRSNRITGWRLNRGRHGGWTCDGLFTRPVPAGDVVRSLARMAPAQPTPPPPQSVLDVRTINPVGFRPIAELGPATLTGTAIRLGEQVVVQLPRSGGPTEAHIAAIRPLRAVTVEWDRDGTGDTAITVLGLAMAGVPLHATQVPAPARPVLGADLADLLTAVPVEALDDPLAREEHSVRLRRCALRPYAADHPPMSVLLCTRRPDMIEPALARVAGQRGVDVEVILGLHGVPVDPQQVHETAAGLGLRCSVVPVPAEVPFGHALNRLVAQASGALLVKMDDDDWYGPDFLSDLLLARAYSQAHVVGCSAEFVFLEQINTTIRRPKNSEAFNLPVSGGAMMVDRAALAAVGGFRPVAVGEDQLVQEDIVAAGGQLYRSHGLGFVVVRHPTGHTWEIENDYFLRDAGQSWPGLYLPTLFDR